MRARCWLLLIPICVAVVPIASRPQQGASGTKSSAASSSVQQAQDMPQAASSDVKSLFDSASTLIGQSRFREAAALLEQAEAKAPGAAAIHHYLGYALWKQAQWSGAQKEFQKAHELDPSNPYTVYFLARIAQSNGDGGTAIRDYQSVLKLGSPLYDTNQRLGQLYFDHGELSQAREQIELALKQTPWDSSLYYQLGRIDQRTGHAASAKEEFASAERLKNASQEAVGNLLVLDKALADGETDKIDTLRTEVLAQAAHDPEILQSLGVLLGRAGLYEPARDALERAVSLDSSSFEAEYNLGLTLLHLQQDDAAEARLLAALKLQPDSVEAHRALGVLYVGRNRNRDAIAQLRAANRASPGDARVLALLGQQYLQGRFVPDAITTLQQAVKLTPAKPDVRFLLVEAYDAAHDYDAGLKAAREALRLFPDSGQAAFEVAQETAAAGRYDEARPYAEQATRKQPQLVQAWNLLGDLESKSGHYDAALDAFQHARGLDPASVVADRGIADNLIHLQRYDEALADVQQALATHPQDAGLYFSLMQAYVRTGQREEASKAAATYQQLHAAEAAQADSEKPRAYTDPPRNSNQTP
jgi:tetratricopeptide (TPR) repeat protein